MTGTNHLLSGALIATFLPLPIAVPLAVGSHFLLDALPHYGIEPKTRNESRSFRTIIFADTTFSLILIALAIYFQYWAILICGIAAFSPDLVWIFYYFSKDRNMDMFEVANKDNRFLKWHLGIQKHESAKGIYFELFLAVVFIAVLLR